MALAHMFKNTNIKYFESDKDYFSYFSFCDFDAYLAEGYITEFIKLLKDFVSQDCIGCRTVEETRHDLCFVNIYTLMSIYWSRLIGCVDQEQVYIRALESDDWCPTEIDECFVYSEVEFPAKYFDDANWRQMRLNCPDLKSYWFRKINSFWKKEYKNGLSKFRLDISIN